MSSSYALLTVIALVADYPAINCPGCCPLDAVPETLDFAKPAYPGATYYLSIFLSQKVPLM